MSNEKAFWDFVRNLEYWNPSVQRKNDDPDSNNLKNANKYEVFYATLYSIVENYDKNERMRDELNLDLKKFAKNARKPVSEDRQRELESQVKIAKWDAIETITNKENNKSRTFIDAFISVCLEDGKIQPWEYRLIFRLSNILALKKAEVLEHLSQRTKDLGGIRYRVILFLDEPWVSALITSLIILNAIQLGLMTCSWFEPFKGKWFYLLDFLFMCLFSIEIFCRVFAFRMDYFREAQNIFDFIVVAVSWIPSPIFRWASSLRIFRVMLLLNRLGHLKSIMRSLMDALPNIGWISILLLIVFYIFAVLTTNLFGQDFAAFQSLEISFLTLFQLMTLESWPELLYPIFAKYPYSWMIFIPFMILTSYIFLNLVIGIIVTSMHDISLKKKSTEKREIDEIRDISSRISQLTHEIDNIKSRLSDTKDDTKKD